MTTLKKSRLWAAKEAYKAASNNYISQLSKGENNHLKNGNLLAKKAWAEQKLRQETERAKKVYADNKNKLKYWWASQPWWSLERVVKTASKNQMKKSDVKWTVKLAEKALSNAKQKLRTHDASMWWTKQQHDALKKQVKTAERNLKSLNKTASRRK